MIHWNITNNIGTITFDSPRGNLLSIDDLSLLKDILWYNLENVNGLILTGKNRSFCTGLNVDEKDPLYSFQLLDELMLRLYSLDIPVYIALTGHAIGAGFLFLCCADVVIAYDNDRMKFGLPEINLGLGIDDMMYSLLSANLPFQLIKKMIFSGRYISCHQLESYGIVNLIESDIMLIDYCYNSMYEDCISKYSFSFCKKILHRPTIEKMSNQIKNECYKELTNLFIEKK